MINAIKYMDDLEQSGFTQDQAKTSVNLWLELMNENLASKNDLNELRHEMKLMELSLKSEIQKTSDTLTIKLGGIMAIGVSLMLAIQVFK